MIEVSDGVAEFLKWLTGEELPATDPDLLRAVATAHSDAADGVDQVIPMLVAGINKIREGVMGESERAFVDTMKDYVSDDGYLSVASKYVRRMGNGLDESANQVEYTQIMVVLTVIELMIELAAALAIAWFYPGIMGEIAARLMVARFVISEWLAQLIVAVAASQVIGIGLQVLMDVIAQLAIMSDTHGWNVNFTREAAGVGSWTGMVGMFLGGAGGAVGGKLARVFKGAAGHSDDMAIEKLVKDAGNDVTKIRGGHGVLQTMGHGAGHVAEEGVHETAGETSYNAMQHQPITGIGVALTAASGGVSGIASLTGTTIGKSLNHPTHPTGDGSPKNKDGDHPSGEPDDTPPPPYEMPPPYTEAAPFIEPVAPDAPPPYEGSHEPVILAGSNTGPVAPGGPTRTGAIDVDGPADGGPVSAGTPSGTGPVSPALTVSPTTNRPSSGASVGAWATGDTVPDATTPTPTTVSGPAGSDVGGTQNIPVADTTVPMDNTTAPVAINGPVVNGPVTSTGPAVNTAVPIANAAIPAVNSTAPVVNSGSAAEGPVKVTGAVATGALANSAPVVNTTARIIDSRPAVDGPVTSVRPAVGTAPVVSGDVPASVGAIHVSPRAVSALQQATVRVFRDGPADVSMDRLERWVSDVEVSPEDADTVGPVDCLPRALGAFTALYGRLGNGRRALDDSVIVTPTVADLETALGGEFSSARDVVPGSVFDFVGRNPGGMVLVHTRRPNGTSHVYGLVGDGRTGEVKPRWVDSQQSGLFRDVAGPRDARAAALSSVGTRLLAFDGSGRPVSLSDLGEVSSNASQSIAGSGERRTVEALVDPGLDTGSPRGIQDAPSTDLDQMSSYVPDLMGGRTAEASIDPRSGAGSPRDARSLNMRRLEALVGTEVSRPTQISSVPKQVRRVPRGPRPPVTTKADDLIDPSTNRGVGSTVTRRWFGRTPTGTGRSAASTQTMTPDETQPEPTLEAVAKRRPDLKTVVLPASRRNVVLAEVNRLLRGERASNLVNRTLPGSVRMPSGSDRVRRPVRIVTEMPPGQAGVAVIDRLRRLFANSGREAFAPEPGSHVALEHGDLAVVDQDGRPGRWVSVGPDRPTRALGYTTDEYGRLGRDMTDLTIEPTADELAWWMLRDSPLPTELEWLPGESPRSFGLELEFLFGSALSEQERNERLQLITDELRRLGLTEQTAFEKAHSKRMAGYVSRPSGWHVELDPTVHGEIISPILPYREGGTDQRKRVWRDVATVLGVIRRHGGRADNRAGGHVHVGVEDYERDVDKLLGLVNLFRARQDSLYRLSAGRGERFHRGIAHAEPLIAKPKPHPRAKEGGRWEWPHTGGYGRNPNRALNLTALEDLQNQDKPAASDHVEFRLWDGGISLGEVRARADLSRALTDSALRRGPETEQSETQIGDAFMTTDPYGAQNAISLQQILDMFPDDADAIRQRVSQLWSRTVWQPPSSSLISRGQLLTATEAAVRPDEWDGFSSVAAEFPELQVITFANLQESLPFLGLEPVPLPFQGLKLALQEWVDRAGGEAGNAATRSVVLAAASPSRATDLDELPREFGTALVRPVAGSGRVESVTVNGVNGWSSSTGWELVSRGNGGLSHTLLGDHLGPAELNRVLERVRARTNFTSSLRTMFDQPVAGQSPQVLTGVASETVAKVRGTAVDSGAMPLADCVALATAFGERLYGRRPGFAHTDSAAPLTSRGVPVLIDARNQMLTDGFWTATNSAAVESATATLHPGASAFVVAVRPGNQEAHALVLHHTSEGLRWVDLQAPESSRVLGIGEQPAALAEAVRLYAALTNSRGVPEPFTADLFPIPSMQALVDQEVNPGVGSSRPVRNRHAPAQASGVLTAAGTSHAVGLRLLGRRRTEPLWRDFDATARDHGVALLALPEFGQYRDGLRNELTANLPSLAAEALMIVAPFRNVDLVSFVHDQGAALIQPAMNSVSESSDPVVETGRDLLSLVSSTGWDLRLPDGRTNRLGTVLNRRTLTTAAELFAAVQGRTLIAPQRYQDQIVSMKAKWRSEPIEVGGRRFWVAPGFDPTLLEAGSGFDYEGFSQPENNLGLDSALPRNPIRWPVRFRVVPRYGQYHVIQRIYFENGSIKWVPDDELLPLIHGMPARAAQGLGVYYTDVRLPNGSLLHQHMVVTESRDDADRIVRLTSFGHRNNSTMWSIGIEPDAVAHELGHPVLPDRYIESSRSGTSAVYPGSFLMASRSNAFLGLQTNMNQRTFATESGIGRLHPTDLDRWGLYVSEAVRQNEDPNHQRPQVRFADDVLSRALYLDGPERRHRSDPRPYLWMRYGDSPIRVDPDQLAPIAFGRRRPEWRNRDARRAVDDLVDGPRRSGDLDGLLRERRRPPESQHLPDRRLWYPPEWTTDEVIYHVRVVYALTALANDSEFSQLPGASEIRLYSGTYNGVRTTIAVVGEATWRDGEFHDDRQIVDFWPHRDQNDIENRSTHPSIRDGQPVPPPVFNLEGVRSLAFGNRAEQTGVYHLTPNQGGSLALPGVRVLRAGDPEPRGTYMARVFFLDPNIDINDPRALAWMPEDMAKVPIRLGSQAKKWSRWREREPNRMFPDAWSPHDVVMAILEAHHHAVFVDNRVFDDNQGDYRWVGVGNGVRIIGRTANGVIESAHPTKDQPGFDTEPIGAWPLGHTPATFTVPYVAANGLIEQATASYAAAVDARGIHYKISVSVRVAGYDRLTQTAKNAADLAINALAGQVNDLTGVVGRRVSLHIVVGDAGPEVSVNESGKLSLNRVPLNELAQLFHPNERLLHARGRGAILREAMTNPYMTQLIGGELVGHTASNDPTVTDTFAASVRAAHPIEPTDLIVQKRKTSQEQLSKIQIGGFGLDPSVIRAVRKPDGEALVVQRSDGAERPRQASYFVAGSPRQVWLPPERWTERDLFAIATHILTFRRSTDGTRAFFVPGLPIKLDLDQQTRSVKSLQYQPKYEADLRRHYTGRPLPSGFSGSLEDLVAALTMIAQYPAVVFPSYAYAGDMDRVLLRNGIILHGRYNGVEGGVFLHAESTQFLGAYFGSAPVVPRQYGPWV